MSRTYAQFAHSIWLDGDWLDLTPGAQHLFMVLLTSPSLTYAGTDEWRPRRLLQKATGWQADEFYAAAYELAEARYIVVDTDTEEVLIRSFLRHDTVLSQPRLGVSVTKAYASIASRRLRANLVFELNRLHRERPEAKCWNDERMVSVLSQESVDSYSQSADFEVDPGVDFGGGYAQTLPSVSGSRTTSPSTSTSNKQPGVEALTGAGAVDGDTW